MNTMKRKFLAITMAFLTAAALCTGCGSQAADQEQTTQNQTANKIKEETGYREREITYPKGQPFCMARDADGKPIVFMFDEKHITQDSMAYKKYVLEDGEWNEVDMSETNELLKKNKISELYTLTETANGKIFGVSNTSTGTYVYALTDKFKAYPDAFGKKPIQSFAVADDKSVLALYGGGKCAINDLKGNCIHEFGENVARADLVNDMIFTIGTDGSKITVYNLETGEQEDEFEAQGQVTDQGVCYAVNEDGELFAATEKGIFLLENGKMQEVVPESVMSTNALTSQAWPNYLFVQGDTFYVDYTIEDDNTRQDRLTVYEKK